MKSVNSLDLPKPGSIKQHESKVEIDKIFSFAWGHLQRMFPRDQIWRFDKPKKDELKAYWLSLFVQFGITSRDQVQNGLNNIVEQGLEFMPSAPRFISLCRHKPLKPVGSAMYKPAELPAPKHTREEYQEIGKRGAKKINSTGDSDLRKKAAFLADRYPGFDVEGFIERETDRKRKKINT